MRIAVAALLCLVPVLTACSAAPDDGSAPSSTAGTVATTPAPDLTSAPTSPPSGQLLSLDQSADFEDGLSIQVDGVTATTAPEGVTGSEGTSGEVVVAEVVITNSTRSAYDATSVVIQGYYRDSVGAVMLADPSGEFGVGFGEAVPRGEQHKARVGFAVPLEEAGDVTIVVDPRDGSHEAVRFRGSAVGD